MTGPALTPGDRVFTLAGMGMLYYGDNLTWLRDLTDDKPESRDLPPIPLLTQPTSQLEFRVVRLLNKRRNVMTRLNSWKLAAIAATFITIGFVLGCVGVQSTAARNTSAPGVPGTGENAPTPGVVDAVQTTPGMTTPTTTPVSLSFPDVVPIQQGATRFLDGDGITITEVRGTAEAITPGNIYCIKGTYTVASHRQAMLAAFVTARDPAEGKSGYLNVQKIMVNKGTGTFALFLPVTSDGWPHVSFYPADGGESFGGNYFGTGNFVLKQWWGSEQTVSTLTKSPGSPPTNFTFTKPTPPTDKSDNPGIGPLPWGVR